MHTNARLLIILCLLAFMHPAIAQSEEGRQKINKFGGAATVTSNGISLIPSFSLGKPAAIFDMHVGRKLTYEPQLRFGLDGQPWAFVFWWRYKFWSDNKLKLNVGAHPAIHFATRTVTDNGVTREMLTSREYLALEVSPDYYLTDNISVGIYYLGAYCFRDYAARNTHFLTMNFKFTGIRISPKVSFDLVPQFYYLAQEDKQGFYFTSLQQLFIKDFPLSLQAVINQSIQSDIVAGKDFVWNISLIYAFGNQYVAHK